MNEICYLCGEPIEEQDKDNDHVIAKQFFLKRLRKKFNLNKLITLPAHKQCNKEYQPDEDYFFLTIGGVTDDTPITTEVWYDIRRRIKRPESKRLNQKILNQIEFNPKTNGGIDVPYAAMNYETEKVNRVIWKIVRGLYLIEFGKILRADKPFTVDPIHPEHTGFNPNSISQIWNLIRSQEEHGEYGKNFSYKYLYIPLEQKVTAWGFLFWDRHPFMIIHHNPECDCEKCITRGHQ